MIIGLCENRQFVPRLHCPFAKNMHRRRTQTLLVSTAVSANAGVAGTLVAGALAGPAATAAGAAAGASSFRAAPWRLSIRGFFIGFGGRGTSSASECAYVHESPCTQQPFAKYAHMAVLSNDMVNDDRRSAMCRKVVRLMCRRQSARHLTTSTRVRALSEEL